jgi:hypothetical protein
MRAIIDRSIAIVKLVTALYDRPADALLPNGACACKQPAALIVGGGNG